jgi:hypothetical protein
MMDSVCGSELNYMAPHALASPAASDSSKFFQEPVFDGRNQGAGGLVVYAE